MRVPGAMPCKAVEPAPLTPPKGRYGVQGADCGCGGKDPGGQDLVTQAGSGKL